MKRAGWWLVWCLCALLYPVACVLSWALQPRHRPGPWRPRARGVWLVCLVLLSAGCASGAAAAGGLAKFLATWDVICPAGREVIVAAAAVARAQDVDASPRGDVDASASAESDAAEGGAP